MSIGYHTFNISSDITKGLTHAIDAELDNLYNCDIQLSANEWQSIFDKIKSDQATQEDNQRQFGKNDNDITKGNQYVVNSGVYRVTENVWNYIKNVADNWVTNNQAASTKDSDAKAVNNNEQAASNAEQPDGYDIETKVLDVLKKNNIDYSDIEVHDIINKYKTILEFNKANGIEIDDTKLEERIANYAKGMKYNKFEKDALKNTELEFKSDCTKAKNLEELQAAYKQFGKEYVEFYDNDGDGEINVHEMFYQELISKYEKSNISKKEAKGLTKEQIDAKAHVKAKAQAIQTLEKFKTYTKDNFPNENDEIFDTDEMELFTKVLMKIGILDEDKNGQLSSDEAGAYLMSKAHFIDDNNTISAKEDINVDTGIASQNMSVKELINNGRTKEEAKNIKSYFDKFNKNIGVYQNFVKTGKIN